MRLTIIFLILSSCSFIDDVHFEIDPLVKPFVEKIELKHQNLQVVFSDVVKREGVLGITIYNEITRIELDYSLKEKITSDPLFFETVFYHEIGHAVYRRGHCFDCYSLMNPNKYISEYRLDREKRNVLINELCKCQP